MSTDLSDRAARPEPREQRSGLAGFGGRPALHPAWCEQDDAAEPALARRPQG